MKPFYYSALDKSDTALDFPAVSRVDFNGSTALEVDIEKTGLPSDYDRTDILYAEPPWRHGYDKFNNNAGSKGTSFNAFLGIMANIVKHNESKKPVVILMGKAMTPHFPTPEYNITTNLHGARAELLMWNMNSIKGFNVQNNYAFIESLATRFNCIGDFMCGYGNTGKIFAKHNKKFVISDINPKCIGYIKANIESWYQHNENI